MHASASAIDSPWPVLRRCPRRPVHVGSARTRTRELPMRYGMYTDRIPSPIALPSPAYKPPAPVPSRTGNNLVPTNTTTSYATSLAETLFLRLPPPARSRTRPRRPPHPRDAAPAYARNVDGVLRGTGQGRSSSRCSSSRRRHGHQIHESGLEDGTRNRQRLNCFSAVQSPATLRINNFPVYGLATRMTDKRSYEDGDLEPTRFTFSSSSPREAFVAPCAAEPSAGVPVDESTC